MRQSIEEIIQMKDRTHCRHSGGGITVSNGYYGASDDDYIFARFATNMAFCDG